MRADLGGAAAGVNRGWLRESAGVTQNGVPCCNDLLVAFNAWFWHGGRCAKPARSSQRLERLAYQQAQNELSITTSYMMHPHATQEQ